MKKNYKKKNYKKKNYKKNKIKYLKQINIKLTIQDNQNKIIFKFPKMNKMTKIFNNIFYQNIHKIFDLYYPLP